MAAGRTTAIRISPSMFKELQRISVSNKSSDQMLHSDAIGHETLAAKEFATALVETSAEFRARRGCNVVGSLVTTGIDLQEAALAWSKHGGSQASARAKRAHVLAAQCFETVVATEPGGGLLGNLPRTTDLENAADSRAAAGQFKEAAADYARAAGLREEMADPSTKMGDDKIWESKVPAHLEHAAADREQAGKAWEAAGEQEQAVTEYVKAAELREKLVARLRLKLENPKTDQNEIERSRSAALLHIECAATDWKKAGNPKRAAAIDAAKAKIMHHSDSGPVQTTSRFN